MNRLLTERQYEELRTYEHGNPSWRGYKPGAALLLKGYLEYTTADFYRLTSNGAMALVAFRERHGISAPERQGL